MKSIGKKILIVAAILAGMCCAVMLGALIVYWIVSGGSDEFSRA